MTRSCSRPPARRRAGDKVVDLGAGVGAAGLALAARVAGATVTLVEIDPKLAALADENVRLNGLEARVRAVTLDVAAPARAFAAAGLDADSVTAVLMNPPFNDPARQRVIAGCRARAWRMRRRGRCSCRGSSAAARLLRPRGTLTLIWRADGLGDVLAALAPAFGGAGRAAGSSASRTSRRSGFSSRAVKGSRARARAVAAARAGGWRQRDRRRQPRRCCATAWLLLCAVAD